MIEEILKKLQNLNMSSEAFKEISDVARKLMSCDPKALDGNISEYFIRDKLGDSAYINIRKMYHEFIGYNDKSGNNQYDKNNQHTKNNKKLLRT
ncbi:MAG TPA: hypothetical protein VEC16_02470 [Alphaproteobacteria bacterium]|nr:hypothetical protein [Alphaproteobacteria bacterium]